MADKKISELTAITGANTAADDYFVVVDTSGTATKKISRAELNNAIELDAFSTVNIDAGTIDGVTMATSDITVGSGKTLNVSAGTLTLADDQISGDKINGGSISSTFVGNLTGNVTGNASGTAATVTAGAQPNITSTGTLTSFRSTGIDDNADALAITIDSSENVGIGCSPGARLHTSVSSGANKLIVQNTAASQQSVLQLNTDSTTPGQCQIYMGKTSAATNGQVGYDPNSDYMYFYTSNSEKIRLLSDGKFGIGTTAPSSALTVSGAIDSSPGVAGFHAGMSSNYAATEYSGSDGGFIDFQDATDGNDHAGRIIYAHSDDSMRFSTAGAQRLHILSDGKVAINKTTSTEFLEVGGAIGSSGSAANFGAGDARANLDFATGAGGTRVGSVNGNYGMVFLTNSGEKGRFAATGEFSVNNTSATGMINVTATSWSKNCLYLNSSTSGDADFCGIGMTTAGTESANIYTDESHNFSITRRTGGTFYLKSGSSGISGGTTQATLNDNGDFIVGGTASTVINASGADVGGKFLDVQPGTAVTGGVVVGSTGRGGTTSADYRQGFFLRRSDGWSTSQSGMWKGSHSSGSDINYWERMKIGNSGGGGHIDFEINDGTKMTLDTGGHLLLNTLTEVSDGRLSIQEALNTGVGISIKNSVAQGAGHTYIRFLNTSTAVAGSIQQTGTTTTSYGTSSDYRLKQGVEDMTGAIERVKALAPKRFQFIADADTTVDGFLAHEAQTVVPEAVMGTHNEVDDDDNPIMQQIDHSKLVPLLTAALKEAITKIEALEARIKTLEGN